jgi:hypothetical protein
MILVVNGCKDCPFNKDKKCIRLNESDNNVSLNFYRTDCPLVKQSVVVELKTNI